MPRQDLSVVGGFYKDPNLHWSAQDVLNWIPVPAEKVGTRTRFQFRDAPGLKPFVRITKQVPDGEGFVTVDQGPVRGMRNVEGKLFVVAGTTLYQISNTGVAIPYGTIPGVGRVSMAHNERGNGNQLLIVNGSSGYVLDTVTLVFQKITDPGYPGAFIADFCDGYLAQVEPQGRFWFHSDLAQALDYNTFDQVEAEADPDRIVGLHVAFREVLIFGADTIQPFVNTGAAQGTFQAAANTLIQCGCSAKFSPRTMDNATFFLDDQRIVRRLQAYSPIRVSTVGIEAALGECSREEIASAWGTTFEDRGHKIYYLTVPGRFTFGYDVLSGEWHRRGSPGRGSWRLSEVVFWNGKWIGGDAQSGKLYELDWKYALDSCEELERERVTGVLSADQNEITVNEVELLFNSGGPASTCVLFPDQPEGPGISGDAPDGTIGSAYSFAYTVVAGDAPVVSTVIRSGELPDGLSWNATTATISGTPTVQGSFSVLLRTTDANGLWAELSDTIEIAVVLMAIGTAALDTYRVASSPAGDMWTIAAGYPSAFTAGYLIPVSGTRFIAFNNAGSVVAYTDNYGASFTNSAGTFSGAARGGDSRNGVVLIGATTSELFHRSTDSGVSFSNVATTNYWPSQPVFVSDLSVIAFEAKTSNYLTSADAGATWSVGAVSDITVPAPQAAFAQDGVAVFGGRSTGMGAAPAIAKTTDGATDTTFVFSDSTANHVSALCTNGSVSDPMWVVGTNAGEFYWSDDLGVSWTKSTYTTPSGVAVSSLCWNGVRFVAGTGVNLSQTTALILNSTLGKNTWDAVTNPLAADVFDIACIQLVSA